MSDAATVQIENGADIITSVQSIQYWLNPIKALTNLYNSLKPDGVMLVAAGTGWTNRNIYQGRRETGLPMTHFLDALGESGIPYAVGVNPSMSGPVLSRAQSLVIQRNIGTLLVSDVHPVDVRTSSIGFRSVIYPDVHPSSLLRAEQSS